jgi:hypothetical protein
MDISWGHLAAGQQLLGSFVVSFHRSTLLCTTYEMGQQAVVRASDAKFTNSQCSCGKMHISGLSNKHLECRLKLFSSIVLPLGPAYGTALVERL